jgi:hypothetical protein
MKFKQLLAPAILALSSSAFLSSALVAQDTPNPNLITIKTIDALGTGCPVGSYSANLSPDKKAFTLSFSEFVAEVGPGIPLSAARKNCSVTLTLSVPAGWQYSIGTFNYRGFMDLAAKVRADHSTSYFFQGTGETGTFTATTTGPVVKDFVYTDKIGLASVYIPDTWSPCNVDRALTINPSIRLTKLTGAASDVQSLITNDTVDGEINQVFGLAWRRCGQTPPVTPTPTPDPKPTPVAVPKGLALNSVYTLVARHSGQCLDVKDHSRDNGAKLQQWSCTGEDHQKFKLVEQGGALTLVGLQSGKTISVESSYTDNGATVLQWDTQFNPNQQLIITPATQGSYSIKFKHSSRCMDVSGPSIAPGALIHQWDCGAGASNQEWFFRPAQALMVGNSEYQLVSRQSGKCLDVADHGLNSGARLQQWACTGEPHQKFRVIDRGEGKYSLQGVQSGKILSVDNASNANGATVLQWDDNSSPDQIFHVNPSVDGSFELRFSHSAKCLEVDGGNQMNADGGKVQQWDCLNVANQQWFLRK